MTSTRLYFVTKRSSPFVLSPIDSLKSPHRIILWLLEWKEEIVQSRSLIKALRGFGRVFLVHVEWTIVVRRQFLGQPG